MADKKKKFRRLPTIRQQEIKWGYLFLLPWIVGFIFLSAGPILFSLGLSFSQWDMFSPVRFVGLENYQTMFGDYLFWQSLKVTVIYASLGIPVYLTVSLFIALLLNQKVKGLVFFRSVFYLPVVISGVATAILWQWIFSGRFGVLNWLLFKIGIEGPNWLYSEHWALPALVIMGLWRVGTSMLVYLAGLQGIPTALYEAAEVDGAGWWWKFWKITLPLISPMTLFNLIMQVIWSFQIFTQAFIMTGGGPLNATLFYVLYLYRVAFEELRMGYGSALAWVFFAIIFGCAIFLFKTSAWWVYYGGEERKR